MSTCATFVFHLTIAENLTKTLLQGEKRFIDGKQEISDATEAYKNSIAFLQTRVLVETHTQLKEARNQLSRQNEGRMSSNNLKLT